MAKNIIFLKSKDIERNERQVASDKRYDERDAASDKRWDERHKKSGNSDKDNIITKKKSLGLDFSFEELTQRPKGIFFVNKFYLTGRYWGKICAGIILEEYPNFPDGVDIDKDSKFIDPNSDKTDIEMFVLYSLFGYFKCTHHIPYHLISLNDEYKRRKSVKYSDICLETSKGVFQSSVKVWQKHLRTEYREIPECSVKNPFE